MHYYTFHTKSQKLIKAVIHHLPGQTPAENIPNELMAMEYKVNNVRQMTITSQQSEGGCHTQALTFFVIFNGKNNHSRFLNLHN